MPVRGEDLITGPEILIDGLCFGRRFDDHYLHAPRFSLAAMPGAAPALARETALGAAALSTWALLKEYNLWYALTMFAY